MKFQLSPPKRFLAISLVIVVAMVISTSVTQHRFYRQEIIDHESALIADLVGAWVTEQAGEGSLSQSDLQRYGASDAQAHLEQSFGHLERLSGAARIKVFNLDGEIAWSDAPKLIGTSFTRNWKELARAFDGEVRAVFIPKATRMHPAEALPETELIEFYIPIVLSGKRATKENVAGVLAIYRSSDKINAVIDEGLRLLWLVAGIGGLVLFAALYSLFRSVYFGKQAAETRIEKLSQEHGRLMQLEKLSSMGQLMGEIAHQLNNPLVGVVDLTELAEREADDPSRVRELLQGIRRAGESCRDFVQRILAISRVGKLQPQRIDLREVTRDTIAFFTQSLGGRPPVEFESAVAAAEVEADPVLVRNALFNLIHNAAQADPTGKVRVQVEPRARNGIEGWNIVVRDSGPGIADNAKERLFEPFFTTRQGGTGLGLAVVQHVAVQHRGVIEAENAPDGGAIFTLWLPSKT
jgi:signal transduction histidine kinase